MILAGDKGHTLIGGKWVEVRVVERSGTTLTVCGTAVRKRVRSIQVDQFRPLTTGPLPWVERESIRTRADGHAFQMNFSSSEWDQMLKHRKHEATADTIRKALRVAGVLR